MASVHYNNALKLLFLHGRFITSETELYHITVEPHHNTDVYHNCWRVTNYYIHPKFKLFITKLRW